MSFVTKAKTDAEELAATRDLVSVYHRLCSIRGRRSAETQAELEATEKFYVPCENACEKLCAELAKMGLDFSRYDLAVDGALREIRRLRHELDVRDRVMKEAGVQLPEEIPF